MSRFYGSLNGSAKNPATRQGTKRTGIQSHTRGWNLGIKVIAYYQEETDQDLFHVYLTAGSTGASADTYLGTAYEDETGLHFTD